MKVQLDDGGRQHLRSLWDKYLLASLVNDIMLGEVADHLYIEHVDDKLIPREGEEASQDLIDELAVSGFGDSIREAVYRLYAERERLMPCSELTDRIDTDDLMDLIFDRLAAHIHYCPASLVTENPYYQAVSIHPASSGAIDLGLQHVIPFEFFQTYHAAYDRDNPFLYADIGFFTRDIGFPVLLENNQVWMSVVVSEIESMREPIEEAHGRVITYGLGLGYYAFMAARKPDVESVTVVELNPHVISLFKKEILPQFPERHKIHIIEDDALAFVKKQEDGAYDAAFSDFWSGFYDGVDLYLQFMPLTERFRKTKHSYWIESCFMEYFFRPVILHVLMEAGLGKKTARPEGRLDVRRMQERFARFLKKQPLQIETAEDLDRLFTNESVTGLMRAFAVDDALRS
jgi:hypothetical protein